MIYPTDCIAKDFNSRWYKKWTKLMNLPSAKHPKFWEMAAICEALDNRGCLKEGKHGLGMGVGNEQLASVFAKLGSNVLATDQDPNSEKAKKWDNGQLAKSLSSIHYTDIVDKKIFDRLVSYEPYDMNSDNPNFDNKFDYIWHDCVIGHLGSMEKSVNHLKASAKYLKPGGWLVFTTELNISSFEETVSDNSDTIIWRTQDLQQLFLDLLGEDLVPDKLTLRLGKSVYDSRINYNFRANLAGSKSKLINDPNYSEIKIPFSNYALTQVILCFQKAESESSTTYRKVAEIRKSMKNNEEAIKKHLKKNQDLATYFLNYSDEDYINAKIVPKKNKIEITMEKDSEGMLEIEFENQSSLAVFDFSINTPYNMAPLVLATAEPINRKSKFFASDWSSSNRPSVSFINLSDDESPNFNIHRAKPGDKFKYKFNLKSPKKTGRYQEKLMLVFEGRAVLTNSIVNLDIKVTNKQKTDTKIYTPDKFLSLIGWKAKRYPVETKAFMDWLGSLVSDNFQYYKAMRPMSFLVFFKDYLEQNFPLIKIPDSMIKKGIKLEKCLVKINTEHLQPKEGGAVLAIGCNPRVGGTAISHTIGELTGWPHFQADLPSIDFNSIDKKIIIHGHFTYKALKKMDLTIPYDVVSIKRNPLDTLASAFVFAQQAFYNAQWHNREVFEKPVSKGKSIQSPQFYKWATSKNSSLLFRSTKSWLSKAKAIISYEEFRSNPVECLQSALRLIDPDKKYSKNQILSVVKNVDENFLVNTKNNHRWKGGSDYLKKMLPPKQYDAIRNYHKDDIKILGYWK